MGNILGTKGLSGEQTSFMMKMLFNILPTKQRLFRLNSVNSPTCDLCSAGVVGEITHDMMECDFNGIVNDWIIAVLIDIDPTLINTELNAVNLSSFNLQTDRETSIPVLWFLTTIFNLIWTARISKKPPSFTTIKAEIKADLTIWKRTNYNNMAVIIESALNFVSF